ncbi:hypothetical protein AJ80_01102 [Polytolypa hystricis UAMH7299]|uniref:Uncharacterized protein n=1 Tax=Polytolypa hystricis (strain UAMH7299) TaxID=1447883 RepID=A0A2B7YZN5_POLH7|nr:hypothetical protein AJ80_01102 [Polytolypa hystricis UAMH7299]
MHFRPRFSTHHPFPQSQLTRSLFKSHRQHFSGPSPPKKQPPTTTSTTARARFEKFNRRIPPFLQRYTTPLLNSPVTHITSFLILHEITAVVPLFGLAAAFHYGGWLPTITEGNGEGSSALDEGVRRFGKWLRKKGWVDEEVGRESTTAAAAEEGAADNNNKGMRLILEFATAYAITKALLPARIALSVWATPWFARTVVGPVGRAMRRIFPQRKRSG